MFHQRIARSIPFSRYPPVFSIIVSFRARTPQYNNTRPAYPNNSQLVLSFVFCRAAAWFSTPPPSSPPRILLLCVVIITISHGVSGRMMLLQKIWASPNFSLFENIGFKLSFILFLEKVHPFLFKVFVQSLIQLE